LSSQQILTGDAARNHTDELKCIPASMNGFCDSEANHRFPKRLANLAVDIINALIISPVFYRMKVFPLST